MSSQAVVSGTGSPAGEPPQHAGRLGADYWRLWAASTAANLGDGVRRVAFPLLAITLTRDPLLISAVAAATTLPWLLIGPFAGLVVDRTDRLRLLWTVNAARLVVLLALVTALATGQAGIGLLIVASLLLGVGEAFVDDAAVALVPRMVTTHQLERANARLYGAQVITGQFIGQGITGALFAVAVLAPFAVDAAALVTATAAALVLSRGGGQRSHQRTEDAVPTDGSAVVSSAAALGVPPEVPPGYTQSRPSERRGPGVGLRTATRSAYAGIAEGVRWLFTRPLLRALWLMLAALGFASGAFWGVIPLYADEVLGLGPTGFGLMLAVGAAGSLIGSQLAPAVRARLGTAGAMYAAVALVVASMVGMAMARWGTVAAALMVANGVGVLVWNVVGVSLRQRLVPDALLGWVGSAFSVAAVGFSTVGAVAAGVIASAVSLPAVFWVSAAVIAVPAVLSAPVLRARTLHDQPQ